MFKQFHEEIYTHGFGEGSAFAGLFMVVLGLGLATIKIIGAFAFHSSVPFLIR